MPPIYTKQFYILAAQTDAFRRLKLSHVLAFLQETAGDHSKLLGTGGEELAKRNLFWAVLRHRVQITRLPEDGEDIMVETWPMPTTRTSFPRSAVAYDRDGRELFRSISLWALMDTDQRGMVLPGKSGVQVDGLLRGSELAVPGALALRTMQNHQKRQVRFSDLDRNGHMNNCRYLDWAVDTLPSSLHSAHSPREFLVRYSSEARENEILELSWELTQEGCLVVDAHREMPDTQSEHSRVFSVQIQF